jgi:hypothetical protein
MFITVSTQNNNDQKNSDDYYLERLGLNFDFQCNLLEGQGIFIIEGRRRKTVKY